MLCWVWGYVTVPGGLTAKLLGVPLALVNADAALLMSNKALMPFAKKILFGFSTQATELDKEYKSRAIRYVEKSAHCPYPKFATHRIQAR